MSYLPTIPFDIRAKMGQRARLVKRGNQALRGMRRNNVRISRRKTVVAGSTSRKRRRGLNWLRLYAVCAERLADIGRTGR